MTIKYMKKLIIICSALIIAFNACKRDVYYKDGGKAEASMNMDMLQYLESKPVEFDSVATIVKLAGLEEAFRKDSITFFALNDAVIKRTIGTIRTGGLNGYLNIKGRDTVKTLSDIDSLVWRKYLERYVFKGENRLKDYPQVDFQVRNVYPGAIYYSVNKTVFNIGVQFNDANTVKYIGYRQLFLSYIPDVSSPFDNWRSYAISSSDIKPKNGVIHTLVDNGSYFGFDSFDFYVDVYNTGLKQSNN